MSEFHYVRTLGRDGGVDAIEGPAVGLDLEAILAGGLPPFKVVLEIASALCEILDIADQDGEPHGDVSPKFVFIDDTGAVSLEAFGVKRTKTRDPSGGAGVTQTDLYGLGYVTFRMLSPKDLPSLPDDPDGHDDGVIDAIVGINFEDLPEEIVGDIQWYLAKLMSFQKEDRPAPVDVWRTFIAFADALPGPSLDKWANDVLNGTGERRDPTKAAQVPQAPEPAATSAAPPKRQGGANVEEDLDGPTIAGGPLGKALSFEPSAKSGQKTAFWSKEQMRAALESEEEEEEVRRPPNNAVQATSFWSKEQLAAMQKGEGDAPRPKRKETGRVPTMMIQRPIKGDEGRDEPGTSVRPAGIPKAAPPPPQQQSRSAVHTPMAHTPPVVVQSSVPTPQARQSPPPMLPPPVLPPPVDDEPKSGGGGTKYIIIGVVLLILLCGGGFLAIGGAGGLYAYFGMDNGSVVVNDPVDPPPTVTNGGGPLEEPPDEPPADTAAPADGDPKKAEVQAAEPKKTEPKKTEPKKTEPKTTEPKKTEPKKTEPKVEEPKKTETTTGGSKVRPSSSNPTPAVEAPASGTAKLSLKVTGRGKLGCSDGSAPAFDGNASFEFESSQLPVTCLIKMDGKRGAFTVSKSGSVSCAVSGEEVVCN